MPQDSAIPLVRLTHMICGYPAAPVKNFEEAYEYVDVETGATHRVRASELSREEFYALSEQYRDGLRPIYLQERVSEEARKGEKGNWKKNIRFLMCVRRKSTCSLCADIRMMRIISMSHGSLRLRWRVLISAGEITIRASAVLSAVILQIRRTAAIPENWWNSGWVY